MSNNPVNVSNAKNREVFDGHNVGSAIVASKLGVLVSNRKFGKLVDVGSKEAGAGHKLHVKRMLGIGVKIQFHGNNLGVIERARSNIKIQECHLNVHEVIKLARAKAIKKTSIGWLEVKIIHGLIKGNMLSSLDSLGLNVKVQDVLHRLGVAKEDANMSIGESFVRPVRAGR